MELSTIYTKKEDLKFRNGNDDVMIVFDSESEYLFEMNRISKQIFEQIDGEKTVENIIDFFTDKYQGDKEIIKNDIIYQLQKFAEFSIIK